MTKLLTPTFRVSFPHVFKGNVNDRGETEYSLVMLFDFAKIDKDPKEKAKLDAIKSAVQAAGKEAHGGKPFQSPFKAGSEKLDGGGNRVDGYGDTVEFATAKSKMAPGVVNQQNQRIIDPSEFYAGCYARATVNVYSWVFKSKKGVSLGLQNLQFVKDGEPFSGRAGNPEDDFDAITTEEDADSLTD